jgi:CubicO group peptidase (beta-lactamase class C family)
MFLLLAQFAQPLRPSFAQIPSTPGQGSESATESPAVADALRVLDAWIDYQVRWNEPGLAIGIVHDHELIWAKGYGFADIERRIPATSDSVFRIGSISKVFTAIAVMQLRDQGKLNLDDPVEGHLPWFRVRRADPHDSPISIWHLLSHTSGLPHSPEGVDWVAYTGPAREEVIRSLPRVVTSFPVGTRYQYSNLGFVVLGDLVAAVSGESFTDYIRTHILAPLAMSSTELEPDSAMPNLARGYTEQQPRQLVALPFSDTGFITPAGDGASSVRDMARLASFLMTEGEETSPPILSLATLREMRRLHSVHPDWQGGRGLGVRLRVVDGQVRVGHGGSSQGFRALVEVVPSERFGVVVLINSNGGHPDRYLDQAFRLVGRAISADAPAGRGLSGTDTTLDRYLGTFESQRRRFHIMRVEGRLALVDPSEPDPWDDRIFLEPAEGEHVFWMSRPGGQDVGTLAFRADSSGRIIEMALPTLVLPRARERE